MREEIDIKGGKERRERERDREERKAYEGKGR